MTTTLPWPVLYADFTTEGGTNQYFFNGAKFASFAAWWAALNGTSSGILTFSSQGLFVDNTISLSATPISSWYNSSAGTLFVNADSANTGAAIPGLCIITDGAGTNAIDLRASATGEIARVISGNVNQFTPATTDTGQSGYVNNVARRAAISAQAGGFIFNADGGAIDAGAAGSMPVAPDTFLIGSLTAGFFPNQGHIAQIGYWPSALSGDQLKALTGGTAAFAYGPLVTTDLSRVPARAFTKKHYYNELERIRGDALANQQLPEGLDERGRADRDYEAAKTEYDEYDRNLGVSNYAKAMDARDRLDKARKARDHHYFMGIVKKEWDKYNESKKH